jgi:hypothetical protein
MKDTSLNPIEGLFLRRPFVYLISGLGALVVIATWLSIYLIAVRAFNLDTKIFNLIFVVIGVGLAAFYMWGVSETTSRICHQK